MTTVGGTTASYASKFEVAEKKKDIKNEALKGTRKYFISNLDSLSLIMFPTVFIIFNIVYWAVYL